MSHVWTSSPSIVSGMHIVDSVSYTHLDVYKRQYLYFTLVRTNYYSFLLENHTCDNVTRTGLQFGKQSADIRIVLSLYYQNFYSRQYDIYFTTKWERSTQKHANLNDTNA